MCSISRESAEPVILLAEDNDDDVDMLRRAFTQAGFQERLEVVRNGEEAIAYLQGGNPFSKREQYSLPRIMLLDLKMPRLNGFGVLEWLREQTPSPCLVVIVLSTSQQSEEIRRAYGLGANSFLTKPVNFAEFQAMVIALLTYWMSFNRFP